MRAPAPTPEAAAPRASRLVPAIVIGLTLLAAALRLYRLSFGYAHAVVDYDGGVYFGSSLQLVHGVVPYRDYAFVQPPVITILLTPVAALAKAIGTAQAMGIARILTALAGAASVSLVARLLRGRGAPAIGLACAVAALQTDAISASYSVLLEPWLVLFCLLGALLVFDRGHLAGTPRLWWGGVLFGLACGTKIWAVAPVLAVLLICVARRRGLGAYVGGVLAGFLVPVLPFLALAPGAFVHDVFTVQLLRSAGGRTALSIRLVHIFATSPPNGATPSAGFGFLLAAAVLVLASLALVWLRCWRGAGDVERFVLLAAALIVGMLLTPATFFWHYSAFSTPFLALAAALPLSRWPGRSGRASLGLSPRGRRVWAVALAVCVLGLAGTVAHRDARSYSYLDDHRAVDAVVPAGACLVSTTASAAIAQDRFFSTKPGCPVIVDPFGAILADSGGAAPSTATLREPAVTRLWLDALARADFFYLKVSESPTFPTAGRVPAYLARHFRRVPVDAGGVLYERVRPAG